MSLDRFVKRVTCMSPRTNLVAACHEMAEKGIGAIVVTSDDGHPIGIITDRDVAVRVVAEGLDPTQTTVEQAMTQGIVSLPVTSSIEEVTGVMQANGIRRIPLIGRDGQVAGIVSLDDIVVQIAMELGNLANAIFLGLAVERPRAQQTGGFGG